MPMYIELRDRDGRRVSGLPDPSGGTFDATGDFDRFFDESYSGHREDLELPVLSTVDPYAYTEMHPDDMAGLLDDIGRALPEATDGAEHRGLLRLQVMARACAVDPGSLMIWLGD